MSGRYKFIAPLPTGKLDIIGDIHGEFDTLLRLLFHLGYDDYGKHPQGRHLVFVGDYCDRGPNSPAILKWLKQAYLQEKVWAILGNHEINLISQTPKEGSGWFFERQRTPEEQSKFYPYALCPEQDKETLLSFLKHLPLILQNQQLAIVHAAWLPDAIQQLVHTQFSDIAQAYSFFKAQRNQALIHQAWYAQYVQDEKIFTDIGHDPKANMPFLHGRCLYDLYCNSADPIRALTSGIEHKIHHEQPCFIAGRWRFTQRCRWWQDNASKFPIVIGHYWRMWDSQQPQALFPEASNAWLGKNKNIFCVDYSIGASWRNRISKNDHTKHNERYYLAALRWPEKSIMLDNGFSCPSI